MWAATSRLVSRFAAPWRSAPALEPVSTERSSAAIRSCRRSGLVRFALDISGASMSIRSSSGKSCCSQVDLPMPRSPNRKNCRLAAEEIAVQSPFLRLTWRVYRYWHVVGGLGEASGQQCLHGFQSTCTWQRSPGVRDSVDCSDFG